MTGADRRGKMPLFAAWGRRGGSGGTMHEIDADYLVVGAGASGMAFVDALLTGSAATVAVVDRRHRPGGHWVDAYPFVRLHQPSANYGVASKRLGEDRIDETGINAGFYERATAAEICDYYAQVMERDFVGSGRVTFLSLNDYVGNDGDGHRVRSRLTGAETTVRARKCVDATYVGSEIPSRHAPSYDVDAGARVIPPNDLVDLAEAPTGFTVIGAGKTAMDTCCWLLDNGVDPDRIRWVRPRDPWLFDRATLQPLALLGPSYLPMQVRWMEAAGAAQDAADFAHRLEDAGVFVRLDPRVEPATWRGATVSASEVEALRSIEHVVRDGYVTRVGSQSLHVGRAVLPSSPGEVHVDCTAAGVPPTGPRPVFDGDRIVLQQVTVGIAPWSGATIGAVEASREDDAEKNRLCPPIAFTGEASDMLRTVYVGMDGLIQRLNQPDLFEWNENCRLNPAAGAMSRLDEPDIATAFRAMGEAVGPAMRNLAERVAAAPAQRTAPSITVGVRERSF